MIIDKGRINLKRSSLFRRAPNCLISSRKLKKFCELSVTIGVGRDKLAV